VTADEHDLVLAGLFELWIAHAENGLKAARIKALVVELGGDRGRCFVRR
jgi:hypothetical protein